MIREAQKLHRLFQLGFLADSPDFIQEKQYDGRYQLHPRRRQPRALVVPHIPTGLIKSVTLEGSASAPASVHFGPFTWIPRVFDPTPITKIGQFKKPGVPPTIDYFQSGVDNGGFQIMPNGMGIFLDAFNYIKLFMNSSASPADPDTATSCELIMQAAGNTQGLGPGLDISSGDLDQTVTNFGIDFRFIVHIVWDR